MPISCSPSSGWGNTSCRISTPIAPSPRRRTGSQRKTAPTHGRQGEGARLLLLFCQYLRVNLTVRHPPFGQACPKKQGANQVRRQRGRKRRESATLPLTRSPLGATEPRGRRAAGREPSPAVIYLPTPCEKSCRTASRPQDLSCL